MENFLDSSQLDQKEEQDASLQAAPAKPSLLPRITAIVGFLTVMIAFLILRTQKTEQTASVEATAQSFEEPTAQESLQTFTSSSELGISFSYDARLVASEERLITPSQFRMVEEPAPYLSLDIGEFSIQFIRYKRSHIDNLVSFYTSSSQQGAKEAKSYIRELAQTIEGDQSIRQEILNSIELIESAERLGKYENYDDLMIANHPAKKGVYLSDWGEVFVNNFQERQVILISKGDDVVVILSDPEENVYLPTILETLVVQ